MTPLESKLTQLRKFREAREKATPGEMVFLSGLKVIQSQSEQPKILVQDSEIRQEDAEFIALAANEAAQVYAELEIALKALEFYQKNWQGYSDRHLDPSMALLEDMGEIAGQAIAEICGTDNGETEV